MPSLPSASDSPVLEMAGVRPATASDLTAINRVVERAVMTWKLPQRVKRLALPSYLYRAHDLDHLDLFVAADGDAIVGVAAIEPADSRDMPAGRSGLLLHGLYVDPARQRHGIGRQLLDNAVAAARVRGFDGLLVKAQAEAESFFSALGLQRLAVSDRQRHYARRYWQALR